MEIFCLVGIEINRKVRFQENFLRVDCYSSNQISAQCIISAHFPAPQIRIPGIDLGISPLNSFLPRATDSRTVFARYCQTTLLCGGIKMQEFKSDAFKLEECKLEEFKADEYELDEFKFESRLSVVTQIEGYRGAGWLIKG